MTAQFWEAVSEGAVRCELCAHSCRIERNAKGKCGVRVNIRGQLVSVVENVMTSPQLEMVEKLPFFHFLPGKKAFAFGGAGCNFSCDYCQTFQISCQPSETGAVSGKRVDPSEIYRLAEKQSVPILAFAYNEPTVSFEQVFAVSGFLQRSNMRAVMVSNGFMSEDSLLSLRRRISAIKVDLKSFQESFYRNVCGAHLQPVLDNLRFIKKSLGWWLEISTVIIPRLNDQEQEIRDMARFIAKELGSETPWHLIPFKPSFRLKDHPATPPATLERCWNAARSEGLSHVYMGALPLSMGSTTFCPKCNAVCIERQAKTRIKMKDGVCPGCGHAIAGVWS